MNAPVRRAIGFVLEPHLSNRSKLLFETRHDVLPPVATRYQVKLRILRLPRSRVGRIRNKEAPGSAKRRLSVARETLVGVVPRSQAIGIGVKLRKHGIELAQSRDRRTIGNIGAVVAR
jgi:hypothetical protein